VKTRIGVSVTAEFNLIPHDADGMALPYDPLTKVKTGNPKVATIAMRSNGTGILTCYEVGRTYVMWTLPSGIRGKKLIEVERSTGPVGFDLIDAYFKKREETESALIFPPGGRIGD